MSITYGGAYLITVKYRPELTIVALDRNARDVELEKLRTAYGDKVTVATLNTVRSSDVNSACIRSADES